MVKTETKNLDDQKSREFKKSSSRNRKRNYKSYLAFSFSFFYKNIFRPFLLAISGGVEGSMCRYQPTCSCYAKECFKNHNMFVASGLSLFRLLKCNPLNFSKKFYDPVPQNNINKGNFI